ncbi:MAG: helix-turn-helix domain-containing protein [bacterium]|nr:helix-turn-helix domain-containing protein [bacterium]
MDEQQSHPVLPDGKGGFTACPELLTEDEAIRYLRLDMGGPEKPELTLRYYREKGLLRGTKVGRRLRYRRVELDRLLQELTELRHAESAG